MITVMLLKEGRINLSSGIYPGVSIIRCEAEGTIKFIWKSGNTPTEYAMGTGSECMLDPKECTKVEIMTGSFSLS